MKSKKKIIIAIAIAIVIYVIARFSLGEEWFDKLYGEEEAAAEIYEITYNSTTNLQ